MNIKKFVLRNICDVTVQGLVGLKYLQWAPYLVQNIYTQTVGFVFTIKQYNGVFSLNISRK
jgi:hypothetical protein